MKPVILCVERAFWWRHKILLLAGYKVRLIGVRRGFEHTDTEPRSSSVCFITNCFTEVEDLHTILAQKIYTTNYSSVTYNEIT